LVRGEERLLYSNAGWGSLFLIYARGLIFKTNVPELNFNITTKRQVISIFISRIGPLFVVVVMLFAMLVIADRDKAFVYLFWG
jgi:hypothetical protein